MTDVNASVVPILDQVIEFMEDALKQSSVNEEKITTLTSGLTKLQAEQERIVLEKVAAAKATFISKDAVEAMLGKLEGMGIIDGPNHEKIGRRITEDPSYLLPLVVKVAETLMSAPGEGAGVSKEASSLDVDSDPDGWKAMAEGKTVTIKR